MHVDKHLHNSSLQSSDFMFFILDDDDSSAVSDWKLMFRTLSTTLFSLCLVSVSKSFKTENKKTSEVRSQNLKNICILNS